jgi:hypothetical protein
VVQEWDSIDGPSEPRHMDLDRSIHGRHGPPCRQRTIRGDKTVAVNPCAMEFGPGIAGSDRSMRSEADRDVPSVVIHDPLLFGRRQCGHIVEKISWCREPLAMRPVGAEQDSFHRQVSG